MVWGGGCFFIYYFQSVGAAAASVIAECVINVAELFAMRKEISVKRIFAEGKNYFIAGGAMAAVFGVKVKATARVPSTTELFTGRMLNVVAW